MLKFSVAIAVSYFFFQLMATCMATFAFLNVEILQKLSKRTGLITTDAAKTEGIANQGQGNMLEHAQPQGNGLTRFLGGAVCNLGKWGYAWFVFWFLLSAGLMFHYMHYPYTVRKKLYWGLFAGTIATAVIIMVLTFLYNRELFARSIFFQLMQVGALSLLVAAVAAGNNSYQAPPSAA